jgi:hypothetical protein
MTQRGIKTVADIPKDTYLFVCRIPEVEAIDKLLGYENKERHSFFVRVNNGQYTEAYAMEGFAPFMQREVERVPIIICGRCRAIVNPMNRDKDGYVKCVACKQPLKVVIQ